MTTRTKETSSTNAVAVDAAASDRYADPYAVLRLPADPDLTDDDVHQAWRARMRAVHPDTRIGTGGNMADAAEVTAAYQALRSAVRRAEILDQLDTQLEHAIHDRTSDRLGTDRLVRGVGGVDVERSGAEPSWEGAARFERAERARARTTGPTKRPNPVVRFLQRIRRGRPHWLLGRLIFAAALPVTAYVLEPEYLPSWVALTVGGVVWFAATAKLDLAARRPR